MSTRDEITPGELMNEVNALTRERDELRASLAIDHEVRWQMLERLGIEWTPGELFYSLVEAEIERLRAISGDLALTNAELMHLITEARAENERLRTELRGYEWGLSNAYSEQRAIAIQIEDECDADD